MDSFPPLLLVDFSSLTLLLGVLDLSSLTHLLEVLDLYSLIVELYLSPPPHLSFPLPSVARDVVPLLLLVSLQPPLVPTGMLQAAHTLPDTCWLQAPHDHGENLHLNPNLLLL